MPGQSRPSQVWNRPDDIVVAEVETGATFAVQRPFRAYVQNPYLRTTAQDDNAPAVPVEGPFAAFFVRLPFRGFGRNPYLRNGASDTSFVDPFDLPSVLRVKLYPGLRGRNPYLFNAAGDVDTAAVSADTFAVFAPVVRFQSFGRNPYLANPASDFSVALEEDTLSVFLVRRPFRSYGRNVYLWAPATDLQPFVPPVPSGGQQRNTPAYLRRLELLGLRAWGAYPFFNN